MAVSANLKAIISVVDRVTGPMKSINNALRSPLKAVRDVASAARNAGGAISGSLAPLAAVTGGVGLGGLALGLGKMVSVNAQFEDFQATLETIEGSVDKARQSMDWVTDFAATTPYGMAEVTDAFVRLKSYGIDPQSGALKAAGDAASAMGKDFGQAVEALADAMTGENERLKEFGITADTIGSQIVYRWRENGKAMYANVKKGDTAAMLGAIEGIWKRRFDGAMERRSKTWNGMWSTMGDIVSMFMTSVGNAGIFDLLKAELKGLLDMFQQWQKDGTLKKIATELSGVLSSALNDIKEKLKAVNWREAWEGVKNFARSLQSAVDAVGGWGNALIILAVIMNAQTIVAVFELVSAIGRIAPALAMAFGVGLGPVLIAIAGIAALAGILIANWGSVGPWFGRLFGSLGNIIGGFTKWLVAVFTGDWGGATEAGKQVLQGLTDFMTTMLDGWLASWGYCIKWITNLLGVDLGAALGSLGDKLPAWAKKMLGLDGTSAVVTAVNGASAPAQAAVQAATTNVPPEAITAANTNLPSASLVPPAGLAAAPSTTSPAIALAAAGKPLTGEIKVTFDNAPPGMRVSPGQTNYPGVALNSDVGYRSMRISG